MINVSMVRKRSSQIQITFFFFPIYFFKQIVKVNHYLFRRVLFSSISWLVFLSNNHMESIQHLPVIHGTFSLRNTSQNILVFVNYSLNIRLFLWPSWKNNSFPNLWLLLMYFKSLNCNINLYNFRNATVIYFSISFCCCCCCFNGNLNVKIIFKKTKNPQK